MTSTVSPVPTRPYYEPPGLPLVGQMFDVLRAPLPLFMAGMASGEPVVRYRFGPYRYLLLNEPEDVGRVLLDPEGAYGKSPNYHALRLVLGDGLVTSEGALWKKQRKVAQPAFHHKSLLRFVQDMQVETEAFVEDWAAVEPGTEIDVHEHMMRLTFQIVGRTLFSTDLSEAASDVGHALKFLLHFAADFTETLLKIPTWVPTLKNLRFRRSMKVVDDVIAEIVAERRQMEDPPHDLLALLLDAEMSDRQLRDELVTLALAGHETTATALSWTWLLLSQHPEVARRAREEVLEVAGAGPIDFAALERLDYVERVLSESMRLYPPVWGIEREVRAPDEIGGVPAPVGDVALICQYTLHRDPRFWPNPEGFDPDRFEPERVQARPRFAYLPFGGGARICIGKAFAMLEAKLILATLLRRFDLALRPGFVPTLDTGITLRPKAGIPMTLRPA